MHSRVGHIGFYNNNLNHGSKVYITYAPPVVKFEEVSSFNKFRLKQIIETANFMVTKTKVLL